MSVVNANLISARRARNDEFYTRYEDVESECRNYEAAFRGARVLCNSDDPSRSAFWAYFHRNFARLGLRRLSATYLSGPRAATLSVYEGGDDEDVAALDARPIAGDGDFRSHACMAALDDCDVVVTNPPFSLFRELVEILVARGRRFLLLGNQNAITYREILPLIRDGRLWLGCDAGDMAFRVPDDSEPRATRFWVDESGQRWRSLGNVCWFTNLDHARRHERLPLARAYSPDAYPRYDNYDAVDAGRVADVPDGYAGVMGVPVTFLTRWNPKQFDVVVFRRGVDGEVSAFSRDRERAFNRAFRAVVEGAWAAGGMTADERGFADVVRARPDLVEAALAAREPVEVYFRFETDGAHKMRLRGREPFKRLLIRRRD